MPLIFSDITNACNRNQLCFSFIAIVVIVTMFEYHVFRYQFAHWTTPKYHTIEFEETAKSIIKKYTGEKSNIKPEGQFDNVSLIGKQFLILVLMFKVYNVIMFKRILIHIGKFLIMHIYR